MLNKKIGEALINLFYDAINADIQGDDSLLQEAYIDSDDELGGVTTSVEGETLAVYLNTDKKCIVSLGFESESINDNNETQSLPTDAPEQHSKGSKNLIAADIAQLAGILINLKAGERVDFYVPAGDGAEEQPATQYCAKLIQAFESDVILINCHGGGYPCVIDVTCYQTDLKKLKAELAEYFRYMEGSPEHVFVDAGNVTAELEVSGSDCKKPNKSVPEDTIMGAEAFHNYLVNNYILDGTASRLVRNGLNYIAAQGFADQEDVRDHVRALLGDAISLEEWEINMCHFG